VWDREIILTAMKDYYDKDMDLMQQDIEGNFTDVRLLLVFLMVTEGCNYVVII